MEPLAAFALSHSPGAPAHIRSLLRELELLNTLLPDGAGGTVRAAG